MITNDPNRVIIFDTTLRDGEQSPGASAGFPIASPDDFAAVKAIAEQSTRAIICGLARSLKGDIDRAAEAVKPAGKRGRIHVFLATSPIHRTFKLDKATTEIVKQAREAVAYARTLCDDIEFSPEDASRTEPEFLAEVVQAVIEAGAGTVNIPDTVGYAYPEDYAGLITHLRKQVRGLDQVVISVHCHNDLGLAVARLYGASRLVQSVTGLPLQRNKAIVGDNAFAHESGIHQHGMIKNPGCYEIMTPQSVGVPDTNFVLGKHSGRAALAKRFEQLGLGVLDSDLDRLFAAFKALADKKKEIYDGDLIALVEEIVRGRTSVSWLLDYLHTSAGTGAVATATVRLKRGDEVVTDAATGDGPVDAVVSAINRICKVEGTVDDFSLRAVSKGGDAQGEVSIRARIGGRQLGGKGLSTDIVLASAIAYLDAVNRAGT